MLRIACLWVPDLPLRAHLRLEPELNLLPFALTDGKGPRGTVVATSVRAHDAGVFVGMKTTQALAVCDTLAMRQVSSEVLSSAMTTLADVAGTVSPRVEVDARGLVFMDCLGIAALWASESEIATVLATRAAHCGLPAWVGIADSKLAAVVAAHSSRGVRIVPVGKTQSFLACQPVSLLEPDSASAATLASWGIRFIGELAALPAGAVAHRLGPVGATLVRRARGDDDVGVAGRQVPTTFEDAIELEYAIERLEPLLFVLRRMIEGVARRIEMYGLSCHRIEVAFGFENRGRDLRTIIAAAPTTNHKVLLALVRTQLDAKPPERAVTKIALVGEATRIFPTQLDLLRSAGPAPTALATVLAQLAVLCGPNRVGVLRCADSHRPEAVEVGQFVGEASPGIPTAVGGPAQVARPAVRMALRAFRPPQSLEVFESGGRLDYVRGEGFGGRVVHWGGPWRVRGEWWTADPYAREYYDVELTDGGVYRIHRDVRSGCWLADGMYD